MRLTPKQFDVAWRAAVKVFDLAITRKRAIQPADADDLQQELAMKILTVGDGMQATTDKQRLGFAWPTVRYLRLSYFRDRAKAVARFVDVFAAEDVEKKGEDDALIKRVALGELQDRLPCETLRRSLGAALEPTKKPMSINERQRKSRAKRRLQGTLKQPKF